MINFNNYKFSYDPFPHCVLEDVFDIEYYNKICKNFPHEELMDKLTSKIKNDDKFLKFRLDSNVNKIRFNKFIKEHEPFEGLFDYLKSKHFFMKLVNFLTANYIDLELSKYIGDFEKNLKNFFKTKKISWEFEFSSMPVPGGYILPHTDGSNKILGFVIPVIENDNILAVKNLGTSILKAKNDKYKFNYKNITVPIEETEKIKVLPFKKNSMNFHVKTFNSLHAAGPFNISDGKRFMRRSISFFLRHNN